MAAILAAWPWYSMSGGHDAPPHGIISPLASCAATCPPGRQVPQPPCNPVRLCRRLVRGDAPPSSARPAGEGIAWPRPEQRPPVPSFPSRPRRLVWSDVSCGRLRGHYHRPAHHVHGAEIIRSPANNKVKKLFFFDILKSARTPGPASRRALRLAPTRVSRLTTRNPPPRPMHLEVRSSVVGCLIRCCPGSDGDSWPVSQRGRDGESLVGSHRVGHVFEGKRKSFGIRSRGSKVEGTFRATFYLGPF